MKNILLLLFTLLFFSVSAQNGNVKGNLSTSDTADLSILNIYPNSFPNVSVVFKAETRKGEPVWNLTKEKMIVKENSQNCDVISLEPISKSKPINLGIVIDHSASMLEDYASMIQVSYTMRLVPKGYISPIDKAKSAVKNFVASFNSKKDFIGIIGFSSRVDKPLPLTQDIVGLNSTVDSIRADSMTALYDAMLVGLDEIKNANSVKVLVVLTDGQDNASQSKCKDVIEKANRENIPIYIIGLGDVNIDTLQLIANSTKGHFYYTTTSASLDTVYAAISKQIQAFYELVYSSPNFSSADSTRQIELSFDIDRIYLLTIPASANFPAEVIEFAEKKEKEKQYLLDGSIAIAVLLTAGALLFYYRRKKQNENQPVIKKIFPNPSDGNINLDYQSGAGQLQILNQNGQVEKTIEIDGTQTQFDLTDLQVGNYIAVIQVSGQQSNACKFIVQH